MKLLPEPCYEEPDMDDLPNPTLIEPEEEPMPLYPTPVLQELPPFQEPTPPAPVGYLPGLRPLLVLDLSGTMHGCERRLRRVFEELLDPHGELTCSAMFFDVVVFNRGARCFGSEQRFIQEKREEVQRGACNPRAKSGRPTGGRPIARPKTGRMDLIKQIGRPMLKCTAEAAALAKDWIAQVQCNGPTNPTNMRAGLADVLNYCTDCADRLY
eukprot:826432-Prorocentrum_minimum.AAC.2